jgi:hypothetical protein
MRHHALASTLGHFAKSRDLTFLAENSKNVFELFQVRFQSVFLLPIFAILKISLPILAILPISGPILAILPSSGPILAIIQFYLALI